MASSLTLRHASTAQADPQASLWGQGPVAGDGKAELDGFGLTDYRPNVIGNGPMRTPTRGCFTICHDRSCDATTLPAVLRLVRANSMGMRARLGMAAVKLELRLSAIHNARGRLG